MFQTANDQVLNPKGIVITLYEKLSSIKSGVIKLFQSKFIFRSKKQISVDQEEKIELLIDFFQGSSRSLLSEIEKIGKKIKTELRHLDSNQKGQRHKDTDLTRNVK